MIVLRSRTAALPLKSLVGPWVFEVYGMRRGGQVEVIPVATPNLGRVSRPKKSWSASALKLTEHHHLVSWGIYLTTGYTMSSHLVASTSSRVSLFSSARRHAIIPRLSKRNVHIRRPLGYPVEGGLGDFLPPSALKTLAVEYQDGLLERLSDEVRGMSRVYDAFCHGQLIHAGVYRHPGRA